jgi:glyoxylase-like metal-dependent hydrolase (beta-lactamase superfamily II)
MRVKKTGLIDEGLWLLGTEESCVYLLEGSRSSILISAGLSYILPECFRQIAAWGINEKKIDHIIILHAHFDHVGVVPFLKRKWPHVTVYASSRGWEVLANPKAISVINEFTLKVCRRVRGSSDILSSLDWQWRDDVRGEHLKQNSCIDLGDRHVEVYETPGHSSCSISAYVPQLKALFPSDAAAIPYQDEYVIAAGSSFDAYQQSLDMLAGLDVQLLCADHYGYITGEEATRYIAQSKSAAGQMIDKLRLALRKEGGVEPAAARLVKLHFERWPDYFVHPDILLSTYAQMLKQFTHSDEQVFI